MINSCKILVVIVMLTVKFFHWSHISKNTL